MEQAEYRRTLTHQEPFPMRQFIDDELPSRVALAHMTTRLTSCSVHQCRSIENFVRHHQVTCTHLISHRNEKNSAATTLWILQNHASIVTTTSVMLHLILSSVLFLIENQIDNSISRDTDEKERERERERDKIYMLRLR